MSTVVKKSFDSPDEIRAPDNGTTYQTTPETLTFYHSNTATGQKITYVDGNGNILGYMETMTDGDFSSVMYLDKDNMWIGGYQNDGQFSVIETEDLLNNALQMGQKLISPYSLG